MMSLFSLSAFKPFRSSSDKAYVAPSALIIILALLTGGCGFSDATPETKLSEMQKVSLTAELQEIYKQSCANCHESSATGAPVTGDTERWQVVYNKPFELTLSRVIDGYGGMPPLGQCFQCSREQLVSLIHYMSRPADRQP